jgi:hypothetical protein
MRYTTTDTVKQIDAELSKITHFRRAEANGQPNSPQPEIESKILIGGAIAQTGSRPDTISVGLALPAK